MPAVRSTRADRDLERQLAEGPPARGSRNGSRRRARRPVPAGDEARRRRVPGDGVRGPRATKRPHGEGRWNGVAILSRVGIDDVVAGFGDGGEPDAEARLVRRPAAASASRACTSPTARDRPRAVQLQAGVVGAVARPTSTRAATPDDDVIVCGDFNIAPDGPRRVGPGEVHRRHAREPGRARRARASSRLGARRRVPRRSTDEDELFSWWDYRAGDFHKGRGMRIDLMLASQSLATRVQWALIDRNARKGQQPSDHAPARGRLRRSWLTSFRRTTSATSS